MADAKFTTSTALDGSGFERGLGDIKRKVKNFNRSAPRLGRGIGTLGGIGAGIGGFAAGLGVMSRLGSSTDTANVAGGIEGIEGYQLHNIRRHASGEGLEGEMDSALMQAEQIRRQALAGNATALAHAIGNFTVAGDKILDAAGKEINAADIVTIAAKNWKDASEIQRQAMNLDLYNARFRDYLNKEENLLQERQGNINDQQFKNLHESDILVKKGLERWERFMDKIFAFFGNIVAGPEGWADVVRGGVGQYQALENSPFNFASRERMAELQELKEINTHLSNIEDLAND